MSRATLSKPIRARLRQLLDDTGCVSFEIVRTGKHLVLDFTHPACHRPVRMTMSLTASDNRAYLNQRAVLSRLVKQGIEQHVPV